jgi:hypothetical protein
MGPLKASPVRLAIFSGLALLALLEPGAIEVIDGTTSGQMAARCALSGLMPLKPDSMPDAKASECLPQKQPSYYDS